MYIYIFNAIPNHMKKIMNNSIFWPTMIMFLIALALFILATLKGGGKNVTGLNSAWNMTWQILPLLVFAFITAGMVQVLIPREIMGWRFTWIHLLSVIILAPIAGLIANLIVRWIK